jgi:hypothetical protein
VPGLRTSMTGALTADDVEAVCSPCGDSSDKLQEWQDFYNYHRPHGSLGGQTSLRTAPPENQDSEGFVIWSGSHSVYALAGRDQVRKSSVKSRLTLNRATQARGEPQWRVKALD